jgi:thioredoxin 1
LGKDVLVLTDDNWQAEVGAAAGLVLVDFWAEWCHPCRMVGPAVEALATAYKGRVKVGKLNVDDNPGVAQAFGIRSIPTLLVLRDGEVVDQQLGAVPQSYIAAMLDAQLEPVEAAARRA